MPDITLQQIETFLAVAEHLNFSEAAKAMYISQPALSKIILRLEICVGAPLFIRKSHGVELTNQGEFLYYELRPLYHKINKTFSRVNKLSSVQSRVLRIALHTSYNFHEDSSIFGQTLLKYKTLNPDVIVTEELYEFKELRDVLATGAADIIFTASFAFDDLKYASYKKTSDHVFYILVSVTHPLASCEKLPVSELAKETFYFVAPSFTNDNEIKRCAQMGFLPMNIIHLPNFPSVINAVRQGKGLTFCGSGAVTVNDIKRYLIPDVPDPPFNGVAWRTNDISKEAKDFIDMLPDI